MTFDEFKFGRFWSSLTPLQQKIYKTLEDTCLSFQDVNQSDIGKTCHCSRQYVIEVFKLFEKEGYIKKIRRPYRTSVYYFSKWGELDHGNKKL